MDDENNIDRERAPLMPNAYVCFENRLIAQYARMKVRYNDARGYHCKKEVRKNEQFVFPEHASNIEIKFKVWRFIKLSYYVKKWDRFNHKWIEPTSEQVFFYPRPVTRKFLLEGSSFFEAVTVVKDDENHLLVND